MAYNLKITIDNRVIEKILLNARKTIDGSIIVRDHPEIDIFVNPNSNKVVAFPKDQMDDEVYDSQDRLFKHLVMRGVIDYDSVQSGNLFMSMEAKILEADSGDKIQFVLYAISIFIEKDKPFYDDLKDFETEMEKQLLEPEPDEYTEFDPDEYHDETKGSLPPRFVRWGINNIYRI
jgi:hypothetical protein